MHRWHEPRYPRLDIYIAVARDTPFTSTISICVSILDQVTQKAEDAFRAYLTLPTQPGPSSWQPGTAAFILGTKALVRERVRLALAHGDVVFDQELNAWIHRSEDRAHDEEWDMSTYQGEVLTR